MEKVEFKLNEEKLWYEDTLDGQDYIVVPTRLQSIGTANAIFYSKEILEESVKQWNNCIVTNGHTNISANSKDNIEQFGIGIVLNAKFEGEFLKADLWLNIDKCNKLDCDVIDRLKENKQVDCSTGIFFTATEITGTYNNVDYNLVAGTLVVDHLAVLQENVAPASKGSTLNKNQKNKIKINEVQMEKEKEEVQENSILDVTETIADVADAAEKAADILDVAVDAAAEVVEIITENEVVQEEIITENEAVIENEVIEEVVQENSEIYSYIETIGNVTLKHILKESVTMYINQQKEQLDNIVANSEFTAEMLEGKEKTELDIITNMLRPVEAKEETKDFSGLNLNEVTTNSNTNKMPKIEWNK